MAYTLEIVSAEKMYLQAQDEEVLNVIFNIQLDSVVIEDRQLNFPLATPSDEIKAELEKYLANYNAEAEAKIANAEHEESLKVADTTISELSGLIIQ